MKTRVKFVNLKRTGVKTMKREDGFNLLVDGNQGIYVPLTFVLNFDWNKWNVTQEDLDVISNGPEDPEYWDAWESILNTARYTDKDSGQTFTLYQDGDLWAINEKYDWDEQE